MVTLMALAAFFAAKVCSLVACEEKPPPRPSSFFVREAAVKGDSGLLALDIDRVGARLRMHITWGALARAEVLLVQIVRSDEPIPQTSDMTKVIGAVLAQRCGPGAGEATLEIDDDACVRVFGASYGVGLELAQTYFVTIGPESRRGEVQAQFGDVPAYLDAAVAPSALSMVTDEPTAKEKWVTGPVPNWLLKASGMDVRVFRGTHTPLADRIFLWRMAVGRWTGNPLEIRPDVLQLHGSRGRVAPPSSARRRATALRFLRKAVRSCGGRGPWRGSASADSLRRESYGWPPFDGCLPGYSNAGHIAHARQSPGGQSQANPASFLHHPSQPSG